MLMADVQGQGSSLVVTQVSMAELGLPDTEIHCPTRRVTDVTCAGCKGRQRVPGWRSQECPGQH